MLKSMDKKIISICCSNILFISIWTYDKWFILVFRARRAAKEAKEAPPQPAPEKPRVDIKKFVKIGRPGYKGEEPLEQF